MSVFFGGVAMDWTMMWTAVFVWMFSFQHIASSCTLISCCRSKKLSQRLKQSVLECQETHCPFLEPGLHLQRNHHTDELCLTLMCELSILSVFFFFLCIQMSVVISTKYPVKEITKHLSPFFILAHTMQNSTCMKPKDWSIELMLWYVYKIDTVTTI